MNNEPNYKADLDRAIRAWRIVGGVAAMAFFLMLLMAGVAKLAAQR